MRASNVSYLVKKGISSVWKNFIMSFASFSILLVSLLQISISVLVMANINIIMGNIEDTNQIAIFIEEDASDAAVEHIRQVLDGNADLTDVQYISPDMGLEHFRENLAEIRPVVTAVSSIEGVEEVRAPYDFASALQNIRSTFSVIVIGILITLVIVSIVIISNTIRSSVFSRRNEITIMKYVGATNGFIKLPFFVEGMFVGILAGAASWGLAWFIYDSIFSLFTDNFTLWEMFGFFNLIPFDNVCWTVLGINCAAGALLGAAGTVISMGKYLKV